MKRRPGQKIKLTSVEELLGVNNEESAIDIEIVKIRSFRNHPFKVIDDDKMQDLVESIRTNGILSPVLVRPIGNDIYEIRVISPQAGYSSDRCDEIHLRD